MQWMGMREIEDDRGDLEVGVEPNYCNLPISLLGDLS